MDVAAPQVKPAASERYREAERALWMSLGADPSERYLYLPNLKLRVRVQLLGEGEPILFVHGGPNAGATWAPLAARLQDFQCIILDRPGCGLSEPCDYEPASLRSLAVEVLSGVLDALELRRVSLICSSIGGWWGFCLARALPERVVRMVQYGCPAFVPGMKLPAFMRLMSVPGLNRFFTGLQKPNVNSTKTIYRQIGHAASLKAGLISEAYLEWSAALMAETPTLANELRLIESALTWRGARPGMELGFDELRKAPQPTSFFWGEDDPFGGVALARQIVKAMPFATLEETPNAGHLPWLDDARRAADHARQFLQTGSRV